MITETPIRPARPATHTLGTVTPYLCFFGRCEEALRFYQQVLGAQITTLSHFSDLGPDGCAAHMPGTNVMHAAFRIGASEVFASDGCPDEKPAAGNRISLSVTVQDEGSVDALTQKLGEGGQVIMAPAETFFARRFAIVTDRFGVTWMLIVPAPEKTGARAQ